MPAPGENPELDAQTRVPLLWAISIAFIVLSGSAVLLRLYTRHFVVRNVGSDDVTITIAMVLSVGVSITTILQAQSGLGLHAWMTTPEQNITQLKTLFAAMLIYNLSQITTKISFLLQYRRIFTEYRTRTVCFWLMLFLVLWGITQSILLGFVCVPVSVFIPKMADKCIESLIIWYLTSIMNIVTDFVVFLVPMPAIRSLQLRRKQKIMVTGIFCLGFFTCIISIVRLFVLKKAINTTDPTWDNVPTSYWSVVELNTGILCACLPTLRPLLRKAMGGLTGNSSGDYSHSKEGNTPRSQGTKNGVPGYSLNDFKRSSSQEGLKDEEEVAGAMYYEPAEFARHSGNVSKLSTAIVGKKHGDRRSDEGSSTASGPTSGQPRIKVTREITSREVMETRK